MAKPAAGSIKSKKQKMHAAVQSEMHKWKKGTLHSGSKKGPAVTSQKQAIAIALSVGKKKAYKK